MHLKGGRKRAGSQPGQLLPLGMRQLRDEAADARFRHPVHNLDADRAYGILHG